MCRNETLLKKLEELEEVRKKQSELDARENELKEFLKGEMIKRGVDTLKVGAWTVTYKQINSMKFNSKLFKEENEKLYESYKRPESCMRLDVRVK